MLRQLQMWVFTHLSFSLCYLSQLDGTSTHCSIIGLLPLSASWLVSSLCPGETWLWPWPFPEMLLHYRNWLYFIYSFHTLLALTLSWGKIQSLKCNLTYWGHQQLFKCRMLDAQIINPISCWCRNEPVLGRWWILILPSMIQMFKWSFGTLCTKWSFVFLAIPGEVVLLANTERANANFVTDKYHVWAISLVK